MSDSSLDLAKTLKRIGIDVDVVAFGAELHQNVEYLTAFVAAVSGDEGKSHLLTVPSGAGLIETVRAATDVFGDSSGMAGDDYFDAEMDPELAMALKLSLEEAARDKKAPDDSSTGNGESAAVDMEDDDDAMMAKAIAMSMEKDDKPSSKQQ